MYFLLVLSSFLWGSNIVLMRYLLDYIPRYTLITLRLFISSLILFFVLIYQHNFKITLKEGVQLSIISFFNVTLNFVLTFLGMMRLKGTNIALMNALSPAILILLSLLFYRDSFSKNKFMAFILTTLGFLISFGFDVSKLSIGHLYLFLGLVSYNFSSILLKKYIQIDSLKSTFYILVLGCISLLFIMFSQERVTFSLFFSIPFYQWILFILISGAGFGLIQYCLIEGNKKVGMISTSFILGLNPCFTYLLSYLFFDEEISYLGAIGLLLMMFGLFVSSKAKKGNNR